MPVDNIVRSPQATPVSRTETATNKDTAHVHCIQNMLGAVKQAEGDVERSIIPIDYNSYRSIKSMGPRVRFLVMHYTAANFKTSINLLTGGPASAHYLIPDPSDPSYIASGNKGMKIFNLVDEKERAWHAGISSWQGRNNLNDTSIGIEIVNQATDDGKGHFVFPAFNPLQISALQMLATNIIQRYPDMGPTNIVGHSDIAPGRKSDPGAAFPWKALYQQGIGAWYDEATKEKYMARFTTHMPTKQEVINNLETYGYDVADAHKKEGMNALIRAFQLHFRPTDYSGKIDVETVAILYALVEKYNGAVYHGRNKLAH